MTTRAVHKLLNTAPIGRCPCCGTPTYDMAALNVRCEECGDGVVASVAFADWHRCGACLGTGRSLIWSPLPGGACTVCRGCGYVMEADYDEESSGAELVEQVLRARMEGTDRWPPRAEKVSAGPRGSVGILRDNGMSPAAAKALHKRVKASSDALENRVCDLKHDYRYFDAVEAAARAGAAITKSVPKSGGR